MRPTTSINDARREYRGFVAVCGMILLLMLALKLPSLGVEHAEDDERIYQALAENWLKTGHYSLQGTDILPSLPPALYDKPLFHHPPMLMLLLVPFAWFHAFGPAVIVSWLGHAAAVIGIAMICWHYRRQDGGSATFLLWLPVLAIAVDPVFSFAGRKIWPDALVGGFGTLSVGCCLIGSRRSTVWLSGVGGAGAALAALSKLTGLIFLPVALACLFLHAGAAPRRIRNVATFLTTAAFILSPWFVLFYLQYGALWPTWITPDDALRTLSPHIERDMSRSISYYPVQTLLVCPLVVIVSIAFLARMHDRSMREGWLPVLWLAAGYSFMMALQSEHGAHLRFLTPVLPGWYMLMAVVLRGRDERSSLLTVAMTLALIYSVSTMGFYLVQGLRYDDIVSVPELLWTAWNHAPIAR